MKLQRVFWFFLFFWLSLPAALYALSVWDGNRGLIWFWLHQIYYMPFGAWLGQPFFAPDAEVYFWARPLGRVVAAVGYAAILVGGRATFRRLRRPISA